MIHRPHRSTDRPKHRPGCAHRALELACVSILLGVLGVGCAAQNSNDLPDGIPQAAFSQSATDGAPGLTVTFFDESRGDVDSVRWEFGNGEVRTDPNPTITFADPGTYEVSLTATGVRGSDTERISAAVVVADTPAAGFSCTPEAGFPPFVATCTSSATNAAFTSWSLVNSQTGARIDASGESVSFTIDQGVVYTVFQGVDNGIGVTDLASDSIEGYPIAIVPAQPSGSAPGDLFFSGDVGGASGGIHSWLVNGVLTSTAQNAILPLRVSGTYDITYMYASADPPALVSATIQYVVVYGAPTAAFAPSVTEAAGPLEVTFRDDSTGDLSEWRWDFGDGTTCVFPAPSGVAPDDPSVCDASGPTHVYTSVGRYDVSLTVTGAAENPSDPALVDTATLADAVSVTILDPSFEGQALASTIGAGWTPLTPAGATPPAQHVAFSTTEADGADAGMPTEGDQWAVLDGTGTDGSEAVAGIENGIRQTFLRPTFGSVLEFDYAFLYAEPTIGLVLDAMTATVSDGTTTVEMPSAQADVTSPYAGPSVRFPTIDGGTTRATPVRTASLDLASAFPGAGPDTLYTLTIRLGNANNGLRSPRAYVDDIRFTNPVLATFAAFSVPGTIVAGESVVFLDESCTAPSIPCTSPTSWRWDFGTQGGTSPPEATGSGLQNPSYAFPAAGSYDVRLLARVAAQESVAQMTVEVLEAPIAIPMVVSLSGPAAPASVTVSESSTSDPSDPIVAWSWDFAGWGTSTAQNPAAVLIGQAGIWPVQLTVTTASGRTATQTVDVVLD